MIVVDSMLGRLSRYLRMIGYEVEYVDNGKEDSYIVDISKENLVITMDKQLHERLENSILIKSFSPQEQLAELKGKLPDPEHGFLDLCSKCGSVLDIVKSKDGLPDYVNRNSGEIFYCRKCEKYYWHGSHTDNFRTMLERIGFEIRH